MLVEYDNNAHFEGERFICGPILSLSARAKQGLI